MPDTRPITDSFPWLANKYKPVFDDRFIGTTASFYTDESGNLLTDEAGDFLITESGSTSVIGDIYRWI